MRPGAMAAVLWACKALGADQVTLLKYDTLRRLNRGCLLRGRLRRGGHHPTELTDTTTMPRSRNLPLILLFFAITLVSATGLQRLKSQSPTATYPPTLTLTPTITLTPTPTQTTTPANTITPGHLSHPQ